MLVSGTGGSHNANADSTGVETHKHQTDADVELTHEGGQSDPDSSCSNIDCLLFYYRMHVVIIYTFHSGSGYDTGYATDVNDHTKGATGNLQPVSN
jgi:hypothetical protein